MKNGAILFWPRQSLTIFSGINWETMPLPALPVLSLTLSVSSKVFGSCFTFSDVFGCVWMRANALGCVRIHSDVFWCVWMRSESRGKQLENVRKQIYICSTISRMLACFRRFSDVFGCNQMRLEASRNFRVLIIWRKISELVTCVHLKIIEKY